MEYKEGYAKANINDISLDPTNPRHDPVEEDKFTLETLMKTRNFDNKIFNLMKDILEYGQNPIDIVGLLLTDKNTLYSKEGNRRVAAFKILNNPELIVSNNIKLYARVKSLLQDFDAPPQEIMCYITKDANILEHAMELKHQGEQNGIGTVTWGSNEKARHKRNKGQKDPIYAFLNLLEENNILSSKKREKITKTNWERLFTRDGQAWLGIQKTNDKYEIKIDLEDFKIKFKLITDRIEGQTHHIITNADARKILFSELNNEFEKIKSQISSTNNKTNNKENAKPNLENDDSSKSINSMDNQLSSKKNPDNINQDNYENDNIFNNKNDSKPEPKKFRLQELYVTKNSKIPKEQHLAFINIRKELEKLSGGQYGFYKTYKLSTYYLIRALIEQCLKYWLSVYHPNIYSKCHNNGDANLGKMIEKINNALENNTDIFYNRNINKYFRTFFGNFATKDNLDLLIHHPYLLSDDLSILHNYTSGILFDILNYILTYERV